MAGLNPAIRERKDSLRPQTRAHWVAGSNPAMGGRDRIHRWNWILTGLQVQVGAICPEPRLRPGTAPGEYH
jgi:hypothetical protein